MSADNLDDIERDMVAMMREAKPFFPSYDDDEGLRDELCQALMRPGTIQTFKLVQLMIEVARRYGARATAEDLLVETVRTVFATIREEERIGQW